MVASQSSVVQTSLKPHLHIAGQRCPFCEQEIPPDKLEEISGRIAARERPGFRRRPADFASSTRVRRPTPMRRPRPSWSRPGATVLPKSTG